MPPCRRGRALDAQVASGFDVAWATVMAAVVEYVTPRVDDLQRLAGVSALGVDETIPGRQGQTPHPVRHGMVDLTGSRLNLLIIKKIKWTGHGFRNFDNYQLRLLLHCGVDWHTQQPTRIRGWLPRLAA